jgi:peptidoglycan hydrolase CwlO-like protein
VALKTRRTMTLSHIKIMMGAIGAVILSVALSGCGTAPATTGEHKRDTAVEMSSKVQALQKQLQERDKRIEELESQLEALKVIDQDHEKQRKPLRTPTTIEPVP